MKYCVKVLRRAEFGFEEILDCIARKRKAPQGARRWYQAYKDALTRLAESADEFPIAPENQFVTYEVRQILFKTRRGN